MQSSLRTLLTGVIDYAGLFPPASLPLQTAFRSFARYHQTAEHWLLGRFICPAPRLAELAALPDNVGPCSLSILGRGGEDGARFFDNLRADLALLDDFQRQAPSARADAFEVRVPTEITTGSAAKQLAFFEQCSHELPPGLAVSFEAGFLDDWRRKLGSLIARLQQCASARFGFKLRCGGIEAAAFPTAAQVAFVLHECRRHGVRVKFTAGLHHPIRHYNAALGVAMHGFINVFAAGVFDHVAELSEAELVELLCDEEPGHFKFDDIGMRWRERTATLADIAVARRDFVTSFGSCSVDEPLDDLNRLGWLNRITS